MNINAQIRERRLRLGLPLQVACRLANVSTQTWWLWENWNLPPKRRDAAERIAQLLNATPEELGYQQPEGGDTE